MFAKIVALLALTSVAALLLRRLSEESRATVLEEEVAGQLNALREHLFKP